MFTNTQVQCTIPVKDVPPIFYSVHAAPLQQPVCHCILHQILETEKRRNSD